MEQSPSLEVYWSSVCQEISYILFNPRIHYRIHKSPLFVPILSQNNSRFASLHPQREVQTNKIYCF